MLHNAKNLSMFDAYKTRHKIINKTATYTAVMPNLRLVRVFKMHLSLITNSENAQTNNSKGNNVFTGSVAKGMEATQLVTKSIATKQICGMHNK